MSQLRLGVAESFCEWAVSGSSQVAIVEDQVSSSITEVLDLVVVRTATVFGALQHTTATLRLKLS